MSDGHYCIVRDLGLVKGGKGMRHHEVIIDFNRRGMVDLVKRVLAPLVKTAPSSELLEEEPQVQPDEGSSIAT
jgi:NH3-dependent NAD+ synthetase